MQKALLILGSAVIIVGFVVFLYLFGGDAHSFSLQFDAAGEQLTFPEPPTQVYKAMVSVTGTLSCSTSVQITTDGTPYNDALKFSAGKTEVEVYNGDWYAGADLGLTIKPLGEACPDNQLEVKVVYYD